MLESGSVEEGRPPRDARSTAAPGLRADALARGYLALTGLTFGLIVLGALVRAHEAGLACPDWPLCFGEFIPQIDLKVAFEYSHRLVALSTALIFSGLSIAALRRPDTPRATRRLLAVAAALLGIQIVLGGLTVWHLLAAWTVTSHLITGNAFAATLLLTARSLRETAREPVPAIPRGARAWISALALLLLLQLVLGGLVSSRFAGLACPEWPTCNGGLWFPSWRGTVGLHLLHRMNGYLLLGALAFAAFACRRCPSLRAGTSLACALGLLQVLVGIANVRNAIPPEITGLHTGLATALVLTVAMLLRTVWRQQPGVVSAHPAVLNPG